MVEKKETKKQRLIREVLNIAKSYTSKLTLRQFHYRLVSLGEPDFYANTINAYKYLSKVLVEARKLGLVPYDLMEDRTRSVENNAKASYYFWKTNVKDKIEEIKNPPDADFSYNIWQDKISLIVVEKEALAGIFKEAIGRMSFLVVCRGYNSLTQIKELKDEIGEIANIKDKEIHCYFFSDYDPSGFDIQRNFLKQCEDLNIEFESFNRIALSEVQINDYSLPYAPTKKTDSRAGKRLNGKLVLDKQWEKGSVELDALDPKILQDMIKDCCKENWNDEIVRRVNKVKWIQTRRAKKLYFKLLQKLSFDDLQEDD